MLVTGQEQLVTHRAVRRNQVITRERHSIHHLVIFRNVGIEYSERSDHIAAHIRQQRILYFVGIAEPLQNFARVIGYRRGVYAVGLEAFERELQLDELIAAVRSPISAAPSPSHADPCMQASVVGARSARRRSVGRVLVECAQ